LYKVDFLKISLSFLRIKVGLGKLGCVIFRPIKTENSDFIPCRWDVNTTLTECPDKKMTD